MACVGFGCLDVWSDRQWGHRKGALSLAIWLIIVAVAVAFMIRTLGTSHHQVHRCTLLKTVHIRRLPWGLHCFFLIVGLRRACSFLLSLPFLADSHILMLSLPCTTFHFWPSVTCPSVHHNLYPPSQNTHPQACVQRAFPSNPPSTPTWDPPC